jgi:hypothetical protein
MLESKRSQKKSPTQKGKRRRRREKKRKQERMIGRWENVPIKAGEDNSS